MPSGKLNDFPVRIKDARTKFGAAEQTKNLSGEIESSTKLPEFFLFGFFEVFFPEIVTKSSPLCPLLSIPQLAYREKVNMQKEKGFTSFLKV